MNQDEIALVQDSFAKVVPIADSAASIFYKKLFELDANLEPLFSDDLEVQGAKLMKMLGMVVNGLTNLEVLIPAIEDLGKRHVEYGVTEPMYDTVGQALLATLEIGLGEAFTKDVKAAWAKAFSTLKQVMCDAAYANVA